MLVVNLWGGPGSGKSTGACYIFAQLKLLGVNCEYVSEYQKDKVWERANKVFDCQLYVGGKQAFKIQRLNNEVDVVITDSPIMLSGYYGDPNIYGHDFIKVLQRISGQFDNMDILLERKKQYNPKGRFQTENEAKQIDLALKEYLSTWKVPYITEAGTKEGYERVVLRITKWLKDKNLYTEVPVPGWVYTLS